MVSVAEHPLGYEYPNWSEPFPYLPELLTDAWQALERRVQVERLAESALSRIEESGR
jgi:hypothetical protein